jgi:hypothetical protein
METLAAPVPRDETVFLPPPSMRGGAKLAIDINATHWAAKRDQCQQ